MRDPRFRALLDRADDLGPGTTPAELSVSDGYDGWAVREAADAAKAGHPAVVAWDLELRPDLW